MNHFPRGDGTCDRFLDRLAEFPGDLCFFFRRVKPRGFLSDPYFSAENLKILESDHLKMDVRCRYSNRYIFSWENSNGKRCLTWINYQPQLNFFVPNLTTHQADFGDFWTLSRSCGSNIASVCVFCLFVLISPPRTNISPETCWLEDNFPGREWSRFRSHVDFRGVIVSFHLRWARGDFKKSGRPFFRYIDVSKMFLHFFSSRLVFMYPNSLGLRILTEFSGDFVCGSKIQQLNPAISEVAALKIICPAFWLW